MIENNNLKVPLLKKDAVVNIEFDYNKAGALVQAMMIIGGKWDKVKQSEFQDVIKNNKEVKDIEFLTYLYLDRTYREVIDIASKQDMIEFTNILTNSQPL